MEAASFDFGGADEVAVAATGVVTRTDEVAVAAAGVVAGAAFAVSSGATNDRNTDAGITGDAFPEAIGDRNTDAGGAGSEWR